MGTQITVKRLTGAIGAEVKGVDLKHSLDDATFAALKQAFLDHCMLVFRGQFLEPGAQTVFTRRWGEVFRAPYLKRFEKPNQPEVAGPPTGAKPTRSRPSSGIRICLSCLLLQRMQFWPRRNCRRRAVTRCSPASTWRMQRYLRG